MFMIKRLGECAFIVECSRNILEHDNVMLNLTFNRVHLTMFTCGFCFEYKLKFEVLFWEEYASPASFLAPTPKKKKN